MSLNKFEAYESFQDDALNLVKAKQSDRVQEAARTIASEIQRLNVECSKIVTPSPLKSGNEYPSYKANRNGHIVFYKGHEDVMFCVDMKMIPDYIVSCIASMIVKSKGEKQNHLLDYAICNMFYRLPSGSLLQVYVGVKDLEMTAQCFSTQKMQNGDEKGFARILEEVKEFKFKPLTSLRGEKLGKSLGIVEGASGLSVSYPPRTEKVKVEKDLERKLHKLVVLAQLDPQFSDIEPIEIEIVLTEPVAAYFSMYNTKDEQIETRCNRFDKEQKHYTVTIDGKEESFRSIDYWMKLVKCDLPNAIVDRAIELSETEEIEKFKHTDTEYLKWLHDNRGKKLGNRLGITEHVNESVTDSELRVFHRMLENAKNAVARIWHEKRAMNSVRLRCSNLEYGYGNSVRNNSGDNYSIETADQRFEDILLGRLKDAAPSAESKQLPLMLIVILGPPSYDDSTKIRYHVHLEDDKLQISTSVTTEMDTELTPSPELAAKMKEWEKIIEEELVDKKYDFSDARGARVGRNLGITENRVFTSFSVWKINESRELENAQRVKTVTMYTDFLTNLTGTKWWTPRYKRDPHQLVSKSVFDYDTAMTIVQYGDKPDQKTILDALSSAKIKHSTHWG